MTRFAGTLLPPIAAPAAPSDGMVRYDATEKRLKLYDGAAWRALRTDPKPLALARGNVAQTFVHNTLTKAVLDVADLDNAIALGAASAHFDNVNDRLVCRFAGTYTILARSSWNTNSTGARGAYIRRNGADLPSGSDFHRPSPSTGQVTTHHAGPLDLVAGDFIELFMLQTSGADLGSIGTTPWQVSLSLICEALA